MIKTSLAIVPEIDHLFLKNRRDEISNPFRASSVENNLVHGRLGDAQGVGDAGLRPAAFSELEADFQPAHSLFLRG